MLDVVSTTLLLPWGYSLEEANEDEEEEGETVKGEAIEERDTATATEDDFRIPDLLKKYEDIAKARPSFSSMFSPGNHDKSEASTLLTNHTYINIYFDQELAVLFSMILIK